MQPTPHRVWCAGILVALLCLVSAPLAWAQDAVTPQTTRTVCPSGCQYWNIQIAIDASNWGDVVLVKAGTYYENIRLKLGVSVLGSSPGVSIIDGRQRGPTVWSDNPAILHGTVLAGFTIRNGRSDAGGGVRLDNGASPTIRDNMIRDNVATTYFGGGIALSGGSRARIENNIVRFNTAPIGGGIFLRDDSNALLIGNRIEDNVATLHGGGLYIQNSGPLVQFNVIANNRARQQGGGVISTEQSHATFRQNAILNNRAETADGGGMIIQHGSNTFLQRNVVRGNSTGGNGIAGGIKFYGNGSPYVGGNWIEANNGFDGGGVYFESANSALFANNAVVGNTARRFGGGMVANGVTVRMQNNLVMNNQAPDSGGGVFLLGGAPTFSNNTVHNNGLQGPGDGIVVQGTNPAVIRENIITGNAKGIRVQGAAVNLLANNLWNNQANYVLTDPGPGDAVRDPMYVPGPLGNFYLSQTDAGQGITSPAVDAGWRSAQDAGVDTLSTRSDLRADSGMADQGYHYPRDLSELLLQPALVTFHSDRTGAVLPPRSFLIFNSNAFPVLWSAETTAPWLRLSARRGTAPAVVWLYANLSGLPAGTYTTCVTLRQGSASQCLPVRLEVATGGYGNLNVGSQ